MKLLTDDQVRQFVVDGFLLLDSDVPKSLHEQIRDALDIAMPRSARVGDRPRPGTNNILPIVPAFSTVIESPVVAGAVRSLLGPGAVLHPHRAVHTSEPSGEARPHDLDIGDDHRMGEGSLAAGGFHQDSHSPLSRGRSHKVRTLLCLYFPQDTPPEMGPTRLVAGSHLHARVDRQTRRVPLLPEPVPAGTVVLAHFDIAHAGTPNYTDRRRYMAKFLFHRVQHPTEPAWEHSDPTWDRPTTTLPVVETPAVWMHTWDWLRGATPGESIAAASGIDIDVLSDAVNSDDLDVATNAANRLARCGPAAFGALDSLIARFGDVDQPLRLAVVYAVAAIGPDAIPRLAESAVENAGKGFDRPASSPDEHDPDVRRWVESAFVADDAYWALAAIGQPSVDTLVDLLGHDDAWIRIQAAWALGEIGPAGTSDAVLDVLVAQLDDPSHRVARTAIDAIAQIQRVLPALDALETVLCTEHPTWRRTIMRGWTGQDQARVNAMCALLAHGSGPARDRSADDRVTDLVGRVLDDRCGYLSGFGVDTLLALGTPRSTALAVQHLRHRRFDPTSTTSSPY